MRKIEREEIESLWRCDSNHIRFDLNIRLEGLSFFTVGNINGSQIVNEVQGIYELEQGEEIDYAILHIGVHLKLIIKQLFPSMNEILIEIPEKGEYMFKKIV